MIKFQNHIISYFLGLKSFLLKLQMKPHPNILIYQHNMQVKYNCYGFAKQLSQFHHPLAPNVTLCVFMWCTTTVVQREMGISYKHWGSFHYFLVNKYKYTAPGFFFLDKKYSVHHYDTLCINVMNWNLLHDSTFLLIEIPGTVAHFYGFQLRNLLKVTAL